MVGASYSWFALVWLNWYIKFQMTKKKSAWEEASLAPNTHTHTHMEAITSPFSTSEEKDNKNCQFRVQQLQPGSTSLMERLGCVMISAKSNTE